MYGLDIYYTMYKTINVLGIFGNIDTSNASSILLKSLLTHFPKSINIQYYKQSEIQCNDIQEFNQYTEMSKHIDQNKVIKSGEIKTLNEVENKLKQGFFNVILSWSNPYDTSIIGVALSQKYNIPIVSRLGDFYINNSNRSNRLKLMDFKLINSINVPNDMLKQKIFNYYGNEYTGSINVISQSFNPYKSDRIRKNDYITILHTGNMYQDRKIDPFINALRKLDENILKQIKLVFIGCHDKLEDDIELCKTSNINSDFSKCYQFENWKFEKSIPYEEIREDISLSDILIHIEYIAEDNHFLSFKLIDYLSYNKPIITLTQLSCPNHKLSVECGFAFGNIEDEKNLIDSLNEIIANPAKFIPNDNKHKYHIDNVTLKWVNELVKVSNMRDYEFITLLDNEVDQLKLNSWINELQINSYYPNTKYGHIKKFENKYTIWVMTTPFSDTLIYTMQNLNYLGYKYKIVVNDNECNALNYMKNNTTTKYWFRYDDDFIMIKDSIEYMVTVKEKVKEPVCIFRLYDLNYGYFNHYTKIKTFARYGIKIHNTEICKKIEFDSNINSDVFYKNLIKYGGYLNYKDWENNGIIVGYHQLFCSNFDIFCLYFKLSCKFRLYGQDLEILWNYFIDIFHNRELLIHFLFTLSEKYKLSVKMDNIANYFDYNKFKNLIEQNKWLKKSKEWLLSYNFENLKMDIEQINKKLTHNTTIKLLGFLYGINENFCYELTYINEYKTKFDILCQLFEPEPPIEIIEINDINNIDDETLEKYNNFKSKNISVKIKSKLIITTLCDKIDICDLII
jgi:hypothetical protein